MTGTLDKVAETKGNAESRKDARETGRTMNEARFDELGRAIVRALLGAMTDEEQALLPMPLLAEDVSEAYQSALGAVHGTEGQLAAVQSAAYRYGYRDGSVAEFLDAKLAELAEVGAIAAGRKIEVQDLRGRVENSGIELGVALQAAYDNATDVETLRAELQAAKHAVRGYYEPEAGLASAINEIGEEAGERELEAEKLRGMLTQARCQLENSERELAAAKEASHGYFEELTKASAAADNAAVKVGLYSADAAGRHGYGYDEDGDLARFVERLAEQKDRLAYRETMARALEVTHPELGAPEWCQLVEVASDNAAIVRRVREAMRGTMGDE